MRAVVQTKDLPRPLTAPNPCVPAPCARTGLGTPARQPRNIRRHSRHDGGPLDPLTMPLLGRHSRRPSAGGGGALADESGRSSGASRLEPAGPPGLGSQEDVGSSSSASLGPRSRQGGSLLDMAGLDAAGVSAGWFWTLRTALVNAHASLPANRHGHPPASSGHYKAMCCTFVCITPPFPTVSCLATATTSVGARLAAPPAPPRPAACCILSTRCGKM